MGDLGYSFRSSFRLSLAFLKSSPQRGGSVPMPSSLPSRSLSTKSAIMSDTVSESTLSFPAARDEAPFTFSHFGDPGTEVEVPMDLFLRLVVCGLSRTRFFVLCKLSQERLDGRYSRVPGGFRQ